MLDDAGAARPDRLPADERARPRGDTRYLKTLLRHFAGRVRYFESWVEPNHTSMWPSGPSPAQYAALLETEYGVFRSSAPRPRLLFAGVADFGIEDGSSNGVAVLPFTDEVLGDLHGARAFDAVALHAYRFRQRLRLTTPDGPTIPRAPSGAGTPGHSSCRRTSRSSRSTATASRRCG